MSRRAECRLCPRQCGGRGRCGADGQLRVARADLHYWEEPPLSGSGGAGAVFFAGCPLQCVFCQNHEISRSPAGHAVTADELAAVFLSLAERGAENLDLVTGTPYVPQIVSAVAAARREGLSVPVVWNSSGYETVETLRLLEGTVDVYLPDFKYWSERAGARYAQAPGYRRTAKLALAEMVRQQPVCRTSPRGTLVRGVLVRHLLLPGGLREALRIVDYLHQVYGRSVWLSLMRQYTPVPGLEAWPELASEVPEQDYLKLTERARQLGFDVIFTQEAGCASPDFIPSFSS